MRSKINGLGATAYGSVIPFPTFANSGQIWATRRMPERIQSETIFSEDTGGLSATRQTGMTPSSILE